MPNHVPVTTDVLLKVADEIDRMLGLTQSGGDRMTAALSPALVSGTIRSVVKKHIAEIELQFKLEG
jgi:hypothetical protein